MSNAGSSACGFPASEQCSVPTIRVTIGNLVTRYGSAGSACHGDLAALYASSFVSALQFDSPGIVLRCQGIDECPVQRPGGCVEDLGVVERAEPFKAQPCAHAVRFARADDDFMDPRQADAGLVGWRGGPEQADQVVGGMPVAGCVEKPSLDLGG